MKWLIKSRTSRLKRFGERRPWLYYTGQNLSSSRSQALCYSSRREAKRVRDELAGYNPQHEFKLDVTREQSTKS